MTLLNPITKKYYARMDIELEDIEKETTSKENCAKYNKIDVNYWKKLKDTSIIINAIIEQTNDERGMQWIKVKSRKVVSVLNHNNQV